MDEIKVTARIKLMEGFDLADLKSALANGIAGKEYQLKNVNLQDDDSEGAETSEVPTHLLTYELTGNLDQSQITNELETTRARMGTFVIKSLNVEEI